MAGKAFNNKEVIMKYIKRAIISALAVLMFGGVFTLDVSAQRRGRGGHRPVIVRPIIIHRPYWGFSPYWGYGFYNSYYSNPYLRYQEEKYRLESDLRGNERELAKHQEKYRADGVITAKEQRELDDDVKDVRNSRARLESFLRYN
jgi:hypothetical protein